MERILVAVDFSDHSRMALQAALDLARAFEAPLHVVHVIPNRYYGSSYAQLVSVLGRGCAEVTYDLIDFVQGETKGSEALPGGIDCKVVEGREEVEILREAEQWKASLIVVGSRGRKASTRFGPGSVASRILARAGISVLVIPEGTGNHRIERILVAANGSEASAHAIRTALVWAEKLGATLELLHVFPALPPDGPGADPQFRAQHRLLRAHLENELETFLEETLPQGPRPPLLYRSGEACAEISAEAEMDREDLVIVGCHRTKGTLDAGSTAARVAQSCLCPVLVLRPQLVQPQASSDAGVLG
jgi:nucleotide-binding universal stress UspA family protein